MLRKLLRPSVILPIIISGALLFALVTLGNSRRILADIRNFHPGVVGWILVLLLVYELARASQWLFLLHALGVRAPLRNQTTAFLVGEVTRSLPLGNFVPNYLLRHSAAVDFGLSSVATAAMLLFEIVISLALVVVLGLGSWTPWLRPLILGGLAVALVVAWAVYQVRRFVALPAFIAARPAIRNLQREVAAFRIGARRLWHPHVLAIGLINGVIYLGAGGMALYVITRGLGLDAIAPWQAVSVYCFSLASGLIEPSPLDVGVIEVSGVGAFLALGLPADEAVSAMLINRALSIAGGLLIAGVGLLALRWVTSRSRLSPRQVAERS